MVVGGEEEAWDVGEGFWKKEGERNKMPQVVAATTTVVMVVVGS